MYLQHYGSPEKPKNVVFYALSMLYASSVVTIISATLDFLIDAEVSENGHIFKFILIKCTGTEREDSCRKSYSKHSICLLRLHHPNHPGMYSW